MSDSAGAGVGVLSLEQAIRDKYCLQEETECKPYAKTALGLRPGSKPALYNSKQLHFLNTSTVKLPRGYCVAVVCVQGCAQSSN